MSRPRLFRSPPRDVVALQAALQRIGMGCEDQGTHAGVQSSRYQRFTVAMDAAYDVIIVADCYPPAGWDFAGKLSESGEKIISALAARTEAHVVDGPSFDRWLTRCFPSRAHSVFGLTIDDGLWTAGLLTALGAECSVGEATIEGRRYLTFSGDGWVAAYRSSDVTAAHEWRPS